MAKKNTNFPKTFIEEFKSSINQIDYSNISKVIDSFINLKKRKGRLFIIGVGGGAGNANHAVNDFRKLANIEAYSPSDNTSELTARINDQGWDSSYSEWLKISKINKKDLVLVFSVGGGSIKHKISMNIVNALKLASSKNCEITGFVGRDGGVTAKLSKNCVIIKCPNDKLTTPIVESFQSLLWHLIVSHPKIASKKTTWELLSK